MPNPIRDRLPRRKSIVLFLLIVTLSPLFWLGSRYLQRPPRTPKTATLFPGAKYQRIVWDQPHPVVLHTVEIDLTAPQLQVLVTPVDRAQPQPDDRQFTARTTTDFLTAFGMDLAINAGYFSPFKENAPWDYYPHSGDRVNVVGQAISNGNIVSPTGQSTWVVLCFDAKNHAQILNQSTCPSDTQQGITGNEIIIQNGTSLKTETAADGAKPYPRTVVGLNSTGNTLWLVIVDGKQPFYSEGATIPELEKFLPTIGVTTAINLDGGGSTTLAYKTNQGAKPLNTPIHTKIPMTERPVANHLGFRFSKSQ